VPFLVLCGRLDVRASMPNAPPRRPELKYTPVRTCPPSPRESKQKHILRFGLRCKERVLTPAAVFRALARVHDAPPRADHLEGQVAPHGTVRPPPSAAGEKRERDDAPVLVALEELALDPLAVDVLLEPRERLVRVRLRRLPEMRSLRGSK
jgi:hypothetical protein